MAVGLAWYLAWLFRKGHITLHFQTSIRTKEPFGFWWDFVWLALFDAALWFVFARYFMTRAAMRATSMV